MEKLKEVVKEEQRFISSYLERESMFDLKSPLRGFFTLFWIIMAYYLLQTSILYWKDTGTAIGMVTLNMLSEDMINLILSDGIMLLCSTSCFLLQFLVSRNCFKNRKWALGIQIVSEVAFVLGCAIWCFTREWYFVQKAVFILHSMVMLMKMHSYNEVNRDLYKSYQEYMKIKKKSDDGKMDLEVMKNFQEKLSFNSGNSTYPQNITISNLVDYYLIPCFIYQLEYPRIEKIRYWYVAEKILASFGTVGLVYISVEHYLIPLYDSANQDSLFELWIRLTIPFIIIHILVFYIVFECVCNGFAEITRYADRNFYDDWWNSTSFLEYSNKWNKPVHRFLKYHVYVPFVKAGVSKKMSVFLTFLISAVLHEIAMATTFSQLTIVFFLFQMAQLPIIYLMSSKIVMARPWLGNALFWLGLSEMAEIDSSLDSLPYIDKHYEDEEIQLQVNHLIEQEMTRPNNSYKEHTELPVNINLFEHDELLKKEINRVEKRQKLKGLETSRYTLKEPKIKEMKKGLEKSILSEWKSAADNSKAQLEHMELSLLNQELMQTYSINGWKYHNYLLDKMEKGIKRELEAVKENTLNIHKNRKLEQLEIGDKLKELEMEWNNLVNSKLQVDLAIQNLKLEIDYLKNVPPPPKEEKENKNEEDEDEDKE
ncbi:hypothetical protein K502DRAFT_367910 [Neoconidiobolus thromboides FSU 785]|nr:hypothetical protein K502DRAFT_367910 [Neoconidiobolus thromboides FSU 785]